MQVMFTIGFGGIVAVAMLFIIGTFVGVDFIKHIFTKDKYE